MGSHDRQEIIEGDYPVTEQPLGTILSLLGGGPFGPPRRASFDRHLRAIS